MELVEYEVVKGIKSVLKTTDIFKAVAWVNSPNGRISCQIKHPLYGILEEVSIIRIEEVDYVVLYEMFYKGINGEWYALLATDTDNPDEQEVVMPLQELKKLRKYMKIFG